MLTAQPLKPSPPPLPYLSSSRPPISHLFPQTNDPTTTPLDSGAARRSVCSDVRGDRVERAEKRPLPPTPAEMFSRRPSNPFTPAGRLEPDSQWDDSFEAFAAGRLQPPEAVTTECPTQRDTGDGLPKGCSDGGALLPLSCDTPREFGWETRSSTSRLTNASVAHSDAFPLLLETIPEHNDSAALDTPAVPLTNSAHAESNRANSNTNVHFLANANVEPGSHHPSAGKLNSSSPDPASSGIGSSVEEDFLSCLSSYSDKFSASSAEESEAQNSEADAVGFEKFRESIRKSKPSESDEDRSHDPERNAVVGRGSGEVLEDSLAPCCSPVVTQHQPAVAAADLQPESKEYKKREVFHLPVEGFPATEVMISSPPHVLQPRFHIITSSPDVKQNSADLPAEGSVWAVRDAPIPFQDFPISPSSSFDNLPLPALLSDQSNSSFLQSLYVSSDSQNYQTCDSHWPSKCSGSSEPNQTLHSANSTLRGEPGDVPTTADAAQELFPDAPKPSLQEIHQTRSLECSSDILQPGFSLKDGSDLAELPEALTDRCLSHQRGFTDEAPRAVSDDTFSKCPQTLQRSRSEGSLKLTSDEHLGASSADLPPLTSSAPLTPDHTSSPVALCSLPPFANAAARSPPSTSQAPKPVCLESQQQRQAASQQNR